MAKGGRPLENPSTDSRGFEQQEPLAELGISNHQSAKWQKLAEVPKAVFEESSKADRPSSGTVIAAKPPMRGA
jgi:hypothetical protein